MQARSAHAADTCAYSRIRGATGATLQARFFYDRYQPTLLTTRMGAPASFSCTQGRASPLEQLLSPHCSGMTATICPTALSAYSSSSFRARG